MKKILLLILFFGILIIQAAAQVPNIGDSGCVAVDGVYDFDLNRYVPLGKVVGSCGTCWGRESGEIFEMDCKTGERKGGDLPFGLGFTPVIIGLIVFIIIIILIPRKPSVDTKKVSKEAKKIPKKEGSGIGSLLFGIISIFILPVPPLGAILGSIAVLLAWNKKTKKALAGLILGLIGILITLVGILEFFGGFFGFLLLILILILIAFLIKRKKKENRYWEITSLILGILSIIFFWSSFSSILGLSAIIFSRAQKNKTKLATWGLILGILGIILNLFGIVA